MASSVKLKVCPLCGKDISENSAVTICPQCGVFHHMNCWEENNGCCTAGCIAGGRRHKDIKDIAHMQHSAYRKGHGAAGSAAAGVFRSPARRPEVRQDEKKVIENTGLYYDEKFKPNPHGKSAENDYEGDRSRNAYQTSEAKSNYDSTAAYVGYNNGKMDDFMQAIIQKNPYYYDRKFSMMNLAGKNTSWNWCSFLFGAYWMVYRKMYLNTFYLMVIYWVIAAINYIPVVGWIISSVLSFALWICLGLYGNAVYKKHVEKIYEMSEELSYDQRKQECLRKGGTSVLAIILYMILCMLISGIITAILIAFDCFRPFSVFSAFI